MKYILCLIIFISILSVGICKDNDQVEDERGIFETIGDDFNAGFSDLKFIINDVNNYNGYTALRAGIILSGTALLTTADEPLFDYINKNRVEDSFEDEFFEVADNFGTIPVADGLALGIYLTGLIAKDEAIRTTGRLMVETLVLSGFITISSRVIIGRSRPYNLQGNSSFKPFTLDYFYHSFPSGHITISFAMATLLSHRIDEWWAYGGLYSLALLNTASRLYYDGHWASDTFISAAIGTLSAMAVLEAFDNSQDKEKTEKKFDFGFSPFGINFQYKF